MDVGQGLCGSCHCICLFHWFFDADYLEQVNFLFIFYVLCKINICGGIAMKKMLLVMGCVLMLVVSGCATQMTSSSTVNEYMPDGKTISKQTVSNVTYVESNLAHKSMAAGGSVTALKVITSADPNTGSFMPTFILGFGTFYLFDIPSGVSAYFHDAQKSMWSAEVASDTTVYIMGTDNANTKVEISSPEMLINLPGVKIFNPMSKEATVKTTIQPDGTKPMGTMPNMPAMPAPKK